MLRQRPKPLGAKRTLDSDLGRKTRFSRQIETGNDQGLNREWRFPNTGFVAKFQQERSVSYRNMLRLPLKVSVGGPHASKADALLAIVHLPREQVLRMCCVNPYSVLTSEI